MEIKPAQRFCLALEQADSPGQAGGKAVNLAGAASLGLTVPKSFVITTFALAHFLRETGLHERVTEYLSQMPGQSSELQRTAYGQLCRDCMATEIPNELQEGIALLAEPLLAGSPHGLAVRSSACCEDSDHASFAGVFDSFLCVGSTDALWQRIKQCWCSCWNPQACAYARRMGLTIEADSMAVLVQETLYPDRSGVLFTADPLTGNPWRFAINATFGFLQAAINGQATADRYLIEWDTARILEQDIVRKTVSLAPGDAGLETVHIDAGRAEQASLDDKDLRELRSAGVRLHIAFGAPVDIEWIIQSDRLIIVQARPVTALPEFFPHTLSREDAQFTWYRSDSFWYVPAEVGGAQVAPLFRHIWDAEMWRRAVPDGLELLSRSCREKDFNGYRYTTDGWSGISGDWLAILAANGEERELTRICTSTERKLDEIESKLREVWNMGKQSILDSTQAARDEIQRTHTARQLIPSLLKEMEFHPDGNYMGYGAPQSLGTLCESMLGRFLQDRLPGFPVEKLVMGLPSYSHARITAAQQIGAQITEKPVQKAFQTLPIDDVVPSLLRRGEGKAFLHQIEEFCWTYGQCPSSWRDRPPMWTTGTAAWADFSTEILVSIKKSLLGISRDVTELSASNRKTRQEAEDLVRRQLPPSQHGRFNKLLGWTRFWFPILDDRLWLGGRQHLTCYELLWQTATRLTREDVLDHPADVFLLSREDLELYLANSTYDLQRAFRSSQAEYEKNDRLRPPPYVGKTPSAGVADASGDAPAKKSSATAPRELIGNARSPGKARGRARVASGLSAAFLDQLTDEDILVCLEDIPFRVDWLAVLLVARGLVAASNCGAGLHHAVQIARECGVVYIELSNDLAGHIADNALIELNGGSGLVTILDG